MGYFASIAGLTDQRKENILYKHYKTTGPCVEKAAILYHLTRRRRALFKLHNVITSNYGDFFCISTQKVKKKGVLEYQRPLADL